MTDNEIIEALEKAMFLGDASIMKGFGTIVDKKLLSDTVDLINRQKAEIERLEKHELSKAMEFNSSTINRVKSEAIKEFAEKLTAEYKTTHYLPNDDDMIMVAKSDMDNLIKEMVGEK